VRAMRNLTKQKADARLAKIEGQIRAIRKMVADDRYCIDVVRQVQAARSALNALEAVVIEDHVETCVQHALTDGDSDQRREKVDELVSILTGKKK
jgi:DNA-binding FrmR family transcriptional regulator